MKIKISVFDCGLPIWEFFIEARIFKQFMIEVRPLIDEWERELLHGTGGPDTVVGLLGVPERLLEEIGLGGTGVCMHPDDYQRAKEAAFTSAEKDERDGCRDWQMEDAVARQYRRDVHRSRRRASRDPRLRSVRGIQGWRPYN